MRVKKSLKQQKKVILLTTMILFTSTIAIISSSFINFSSIKENINWEDNQNEDFNRLTPLNNPKLSVFGNAPWWNPSYQFRILINVTNPYLKNIKNFGVNVSFNYANLVSAGKMQSDLDDIRIVEMVGGSGVLRDYYVVKDYPSLNYATVFFNTNITADETETDTYLYCGNPTATNFESDQPSETFGWIKNGNFELDISTSPKFEPFGWYFSHNPVNSIMADANPNPNPYNSSATSYQYFVNKLEDNLDGGHRVASGIYSYKFGAEDHTLPDSLVNDYAGTLFSYPFTVPIIEGGDISLILYRNIRTHRFERPKNMGTINNDGYFIRLLNGSDTVYDTNPDNHDDNDISPTFQNYVESYDGYCYYNNAAKKWDVETQLIDYPGHTDVVDTYSDEYGGGADGDLTGYLNFDISTYEGKPIFFELGVWGDESNTLKKEKSAFFQVDDLRFNYTLSTSINEVQARKSDVTVIARDVDGNIVPNAHIIIINESSSTIVASGFTSVYDGSISFSQLLNGQYNVTANYTLGSREKVVGYQMRDFNGTSYTITLTLNLWRIEFNVIDWDGIPLNLGSIEISESLGGDLLETLTLNQNGKAVFRWLNTSDYYFKIYYENDDYVGDRFLLNESYIYRNLYERQGEKFRNHTIWVNNTNTLSKGTNSYSLSEIIYTNGSRTEFGDKKIIKANISLTNMVNQLTNISIYYVDKNNSTGTGDQNLIYFEEGYGPGEDNDFIELDIPMIENTKLENEKYEVFGLLVEINGINFTQCNGIININTIETCNIFNRTHLARLNMRVIRLESGEEVPYPALIKITDNTTKQPVVNLTSRLDRNGYTYTAINDLPFWFLKDRTYNISINSLNVTNVDFNVTYITPYQWHPTSVNGVSWYNYTLYGEASITFNLIFPSEYDINITNYVTSFFNASGTAEVQWGQDMSFSLDFYITDDNGETWNPITALSASCTIYIREAGDDVVQYTNSLTRGTGDGNFTITINSNMFSAGGDAKYYTVRIKGSYPGYPEPNPQNFLVKINAIPTTISAHDYDSYSSIPSKTYSAYYDELINVTIKYSIEASGTSLTNALLTYEWIGLDPVTFYLDPRNNDYFTFTINTADAETTGLKVISISAYLENYKTKLDFLVYLNILERRTTLNDEVSDLLYINSIIFVQDPEYFDFRYNDATTNETIGDLNVATFVWEELYANGTKIPGSFGSGTLNQNVDSSYTLDFNTELKPVGYYFLYISMKKQNYVQKNAFINLVINLRTFVPTIDTPLLGSNNQIQIEQGTDIDFEIDLWDETRDVELVNATIKLNFRGIDYFFTENVSGTYILTLLTRDIDTFINPKTFVGKIHMEAANFTIQEITIYVTVKMEEIFPGMPTFYFILITASIIGVVGSAIAYRVIQQARIPKHVKKIRKVKGLIKSKKSVAEIISIPTKERMIAKLFGSDWKEIGISFEETLGIQDLKSKTLPIKEKSRNQELAIDKIIKEKITKEKKPKKKLKKEKFLEERIPEKIPEEVSEVISEGIPEEISEVIPEEVPEVIPEEVTEVIPEEVTEEIPEQIPEEVPEEISEEITEEIPEEIPEEVPEEISEEITEEIPEEVPEEILEEITEEIPEEIPEEVPEEVPEEIPEEVPEVIPEEVPEVKPEEIPEEVPEVKPEEIPEEKPEDEILKKRGDED